MPGLEPVLLPDPLVTIDTSGLCRRCQASAADGRDEVRLTASLGDHGVGFEVIEHARSRPPQPSRAPRSSRRNESRRRLCCTRPAATRSRSSRRRIGSTCAGPPMRVRFWSILLTLSASPERGRWTYAGGFTSGRRRVRARAAGAVPGAADLTSYWGSRFRGGAFRGRLRRGSARSAPLALRRLAARRLGVAARLRRSIGRGVLPSRARRADRAPSGRVAVVR